MKCDVEGKKRVGHTSLVSHHHRSVLVNLSYSTISPLSPPSLLPLFVHSSLLSKYRRGLHSLSVSICTEKQSQSRINWETDGRRKGRYHSVPPILTIIPSHSHMVRDWALLIEVYISFIHLVIDRAHKKDYCIRLSQRRGSDSFHFVFWMAVHNIEEWIVHSYRISSSFFFFRWWLSSTHRLFEVVWNLLLFELAINFVCPSTILLLPLIIAKRIKLSLFQTICLMMKGSKDCLVVMLH